jgi:hypothetical protein
MPLAAVRSRERPKRRANHPLDLFHHRRFHHRRADGIALV